MLYTYNMCRLSCVLYVSLMNQLCFPPNVHVRTEAGEGKNTADSGY